MPCETKPARATASGSRSGSGAASRAAANSASSTDGRQDRLVAAVDQQRARRRRPAPGRPRGGGRDLRRDGADRGRDPGLQRRRRGGEGAELGGSRSSCSRFMRSRRRSCPTSRCRCGRRCRSRPSSPARSGAGQLGPGLRPVAGGLGQQRAVQPVDGVAAAFDRRRGELELVVEARHGRAVRGEVGDRPGCRWRWRPAPHRPRWPARRWDAR